MAHTSAKVADGKPVAGHSPMEVDQALSDRSLPEAHILDICALANFPPSPETKNKKTPNNTSANDPLFDSRPSCLNLVFTNPHPPPTSPLLPLLKDHQALPLSSCKQPPSVNQPHPYPNSKTKSQPPPDKTTKPVKVPPNPPTLSPTSPTSKSNPNSPLTTLCESLTGATAQK